jgi:hypothetical protein
MKITRVSAEPARAVAPDGVTCSAGRDCVAPAAERGHGHARWHAAVGGTPSGAAMRHARARARAATR